MSVQYLNEEHYCITCSRVLPPGDAPGSMCRDCFYVRRVPRGVKVEPVTRRGETPVTPALVTGICRECGEVLQKPKRGPMPVFCSDACRQAAHRKEQA